MSLKIELIKELEISWSIIKTMWEILKWRKECIGNFSMAFFLSFNALFWISRGSFRFRIPGRNASTRNVLYAERNLEGEPPGLRHKVRQTVVTCARLGHAPAPVWTCTCKYSSTYYSDMCSLLSSNINTHAATADDEYSEYSLCIAYRNLNDHKLRPLLASWTPIYLLIIAALRQSL